MKQIQWMNLGPSRWLAVVLTLVVILLASFSETWSHAAALNQTVPTRTPSPAPPASTATPTSQPAPPTVPPTPTLTPPSPVPTAASRPQDTAQPLPANTPITPQPTVAPTPPTLPVTGAPAIGERAIVLIALAVAGALLPFMCRGSRRETL